MKLLLVIFAVMVRICMSYPVIQQNIDELLLNALLNDMALDFDDFSLHTLQKPHDALEKVKQSSDVHKPTAVATQSLNSSNPFPALNITNVEDKQNLSVEQDTTTATLPTAPQVADTKVTIPTTASESIVAETGFNATPNYPLLGLLTGTTVSTTSLEKQLVDQLSTVADAADIDNSYVTDLVTTPAPPVTTLAYAQDNIKVLWNKALGIVNEFTTEMSIVGWTNLFTTPVTADIHHPNHDFSSLEIEGTVENFSSSDYIDDALSAVDDLSSLLADILTLNFK